MTATKTYIVQEDTPRLGRAGAAVQLTDQQAKYLVLSGQVLPEAEHKALQTAKPKASTKSGGR